MKGLRGIHIKPKPTPPLSCLVIANLISSDKYITPVHSSLSNCRFWKCQNTTSSLLAGARLDSLLPVAFLRIRVIAFLYSRPDPI